MALHDLLQVPHQESHGKFNPRINGASFRPIAPIPSASLYSGFKRAWDLRTVVARDARDYSSRDARDVPRKERHDTHYYNSASGAGIANHDDAVILKGP